jgi:TolB-like protein/Tfp pilus assembly protein PilF
VVAFRIDLAPMPADLEYFLNTSQWLDASASAVDSALPKLVDAVRRAVASQPVATPAHASDTATRVADHSQARPIGTKARPQLRRPIVAAIIVTSAVALSYFVVNKFWLSKRVSVERPAATVAIVAPTSPASDAAISEKSVAVLPFVDMSEKKDQEYFSDGLSEELIDMLTRIPGLRVPARTSSFYFKGKSEDIPTIARRLRVAHVLEGSVRESGMTLRITAQLIRADNGYHLWSQTYDRKLDDIFKVQDDIAGAVVSALKVSLVDSSTLKVTTPKNTEAYTLYLQGRAINRNASNKTQFDSAAEYMRRALKADPTFAEAWAWLANVLTNEVLLNFVRGDAVAAEVRGAVEHALALDPNSSIAHLAKGGIYWILDWDWEAALPEFQKAYDLDPTDANVNNQLAVALDTLRSESDTVLALYRKAVELDPINTEYSANIGGYYVSRGKLPEAETVLRKAIDLFPTGENLHSFLGLVLLLRGEATAALAEFQRDPDESNQREGAALAYFALGRRAEANTALSEMKRLDATNHASNIAEAFAYRGEIDQAFAWLEHAYQERDLNVTQINRDPLMKSLHRDPRWKAFLHKMKLPE